MSAEQMIEAGEFMMAVAAIAKDHQEASDSGEAPRFNQRTMAGLLDGLTVVGRQLIADGADYLEHSNKARPGV
jgi:hypothetical protein